jgi:hypothetical protein
MHYCVGPPASVTVGAIAESYSGQQFICRDYVMYYLEPSYFHLTGNPRLV